VRRNNVFSKAKTAQEEEKRQLVPTIVPGDTALLLLLLLFPLFTDYEDIFHPQNLLRRDNANERASETKRRERRNSKYMKCLELLWVDIVLRIQRLKTF
jgi:hypothetical protein